MNDQLNQLDDNDDNQDLEPESPKKKTLSEYSDATASKPKKKKKKRVGEKQQIILNVGDTVYPVVRYVGKKMLKWKLAYEKESWNWDVYWTDSAVQAETLGKMQPHQKINHFPGMYSLARKNHLGRNLMKMCKQFPDSYKFFPKTWLLPAEINDFRQQFQKGKSRTFILKPEASCQGRGIFLTRDLDDISAHEHYVAQRYLTKPYLIDGLKFDLRIYVLLAGCDPLRIYIYKEGLARFATEEYIAPNRENMNNVCMHLTNYAINKDNENFVFNEDENDMSVGHKRSLTSVFDLLRENGEDVDKLWKTIKRMMIKTFCAVQPILSHHYKSCQPDNFINNMCFELLGMDVILDAKLKPYLLEVNHTPSFTTDTPLDQVIKRNLICDALKLMNVSVKQRNDIINERKELMQQRVLTGKKTKLTLEAKQEMIDKLQKQRDEWENAHQGNFEKMYPLENPEEDYNTYLEYSRKLYEEQTGAHIRRNTKKGGSVATGQQQQNANNSQVTQANANQNLVKNSKSQDLEKIYASKQVIKNKPNEQPPQQQQQQSSTQTKLSITQTSVTQQLKPQSSQEFSTNNNTNDQQISESFMGSQITQQQSPQRSINRIESRGKSFKVQSKQQIVRTTQKEFPAVLQFQEEEQLQQQPQPQQLNLQDKYLLYLKHQEAMQRKAKQNQQGYHRIIESPPDKFKKEETLSRYLGDQMNGTKQTQIYRIVQTQQQPTIQGNYLTPKLFQIQGVNLQHKTIRKFI